MWKTTTSREQMETDERDGAYEMMTEALKFVEGCRGRRFVVFCEGSAVLALAVDVLNQLGGLLDGQTVIKWYDDRDVFMAKMGLEDAAAAEEEQD